MESSPFAPQFACISAADVTLRSEWWLSAAIFEITTVDG